MDIASTQLQRSESGKQLLRPDSATSSLDHVFHAQEDLITLLSVATTFLLRPSSSYCGHPIFRGRGNVTECEGGIT